MKAVRTRASTVARSALKGVADLAVAASTARINPFAPALAVLQYGPHFGALVAASARRFGSHVALVDEHGSMTYSELWELASRLDLGTDPVAVQCPDDRWILAAVAAAGLCGADATLVGPSAAAAHGHSRVLGPRELAELPERTGRPRRRSPSLNFMTTGSTGSPKLVKRSRFSPVQAFPAASLVAALGLRRGEAVLILPPLFHGHGFSLATACLVSGAPIILGPTALAASLIREHSVGLVAGVPAQLGGLVGQDLPSVRLIAAGSARLPPELAAGLLSIADVVDFFGSTETGTATIARADDVRAGTVGRPAAGVRIAIVDDSGAVQPRGAQGWVTVSSVLNFTGRGPLRTGDRGFVDPQGRLVIVGRADGVIVSGGENISPGALAAFLRSQPEVVDAAATAVPDARLDWALAARVTLRAPMTESELRARVRAQLGAGFMPRDLVMVDEAGQALDAS